MLGFSDLLKSNFGDSATPLTSLLEPRLKGGQDAATAPPPPTSFDTPVGKRRVPREKNPRKPNFEMIKDARQGVLSGFLRSGKLFRASDFVGIVNPKTAIITLNDIYEFETRGLTAIGDQPISRPPLSSMVSFRKTAEQGADDEKNLRNLFYISLGQDELPSFHFWTKAGDLDPVTAGEPIDWDKLFDQNPPSPATTAKIATLENERKEKVQRGPEEQQNTQNKQPLEFLDHYNDINTPALGREPPEGRPASDIDPVLQLSVSSGSAQLALEAEVLLQFNRGGMYLREFTHKALYAMACWLVKNEEEDEKEYQYGEDEAEAEKGPTGIRDMFLDILEPGKDVRQEKIVSVSRASNRSFQENIKLFFGQRDNKFRIRSTRYQSSWNIDSGFDSGGVGDLKYDLKLVRPNVGYCYCSANWHNPTTLDLNSMRFEKAVEFLFNWELSAHPNSDHLSLDIPDHGSFDLDRKSILVVNASIQKIFAELSATPAKPGSYPAEIFIRDVVEEDDTDGSDFLGNGSPEPENVMYGEDPGGVPDVHQSISGVAPRIDRGSIIASDMPNQPPSGNLGSLITGQSNGPNPMKAAGEGRDLPSIQPGLLNVSETAKLQERLRIAEASVEKSDNLHERLRIAEDKVSEMSGLKERLKTSEDRAKLQCSCPFCPQDWAGATKLQQQDHLRLHQKSIVHQPAPQQCPQPNCTSWLGENQSESTYEAISEHLRLHIEEEHAEDGVCEHQYCHTNMYALTAEQQNEHESIHRDNRKIEEERDQLLEQVRGLKKTLKKPDRLQKQVGNLEDIAKQRDLLQEPVEDLETTAIECSRLQQQVKHLQDAAHERDRLLADLADITKERKSLQERAVELERRLKAAPDFDERIQTRDADPQREVDEEPKQPNQPEHLEKLRYCNVCLKSVDKMSANAKAKHAEKCETSVSEFPLFRPAEAKAEREKRTRSRDLVKPQAPEETEPGAEKPGTGKKRIRKAPAHAASSESQQDEVESRDTIKQPDASKATGRKTLKRKNDAFKPPKEDESEDEELESPRKKPKLKTKAAKSDKETGPTRRSNRAKDMYKPPEEEEDNEEEAYDEPSSSARGKRKKKAAGETTVSKKTKTKK